MRSSGRVVLLVVVVVALLPGLRRLWPEAAGSLVPPASCQDVRTADPAADDGDYVIVANGRILSVYCHDMVGTPKEYITLRHTETDRNFSQYTAGGASPGTNVRTVFTRVRLDPASLVVDVGDLTFATSTGRLQHSALTRGPSSPFVESMPYGVAETCTTRPDGVANVDFRGTPYAVAEPFIVQSFAGTGNAAKSADDQVVDLTSSGYCGWIAPAPAWDNPINPAPGNFRMELKCAPVTADTGGGFCEEAQVLPSSSTTTTSSSTTTTTTSSSTTTTTTEPTPPTTAAPPASAPPPARDTGYWLLGRDGAVHRFGEAGSVGDAAGKVPAGTDAVDAAATPSGNGLWILTDRGKVVQVGDAAALGSLADGALAGGERAVSLAPTPSGAGYWIVTSAGRVHPFGDARPFGDLTGRAPRAPIRRGVASTRGGGYYLVGADGGVFTFGDARFSGSLAGRGLNAPVVAMALDGDGTGYWLVAADGGVFGFDAPFRGSVPPKDLNGPVVAADTYGDGYLLAAADGGVFVFSNRPFYGSLGDHPPAQPITGVAIH